MVIDSTLKGMKKRKFLVLQEQVMVGRLQAFINFSVIFMAGQKKKKIMEYTM